MTENFKQKLNRIRAFVFDIDGVLTDGKITFHADNTTSRSLNAKDGYALQRALRAGFFVAVISYAKDEVLRERLKNIGLTEVYLGSTDKEETLKEFAAVYSLGYDEIAFMGDDVPDILAMKRCGIAACPYDAAPDIREISIYISPKKGGEGCVRDIIEQALRLSGKW
ncbi:MAG TPA: 3-deoxy-D-manno-octulosonate 8-phosphate phosphatase [Bacteroidia bacterium]|nr:3-deoxy-D-manno-octulosonate 8-phosphate phosphatase [Bacteroidia bacterium]